MEGEERIEVSPFLYIFTEKENKEEVKYWP